MPSFVHDARRGNRAGAPFLAAYDNGSTRARIAVGVFPVSCGSLSVAPFRDSRRASSTAVSAMPMSWIALKASAVAATASARPFSPVLLITCSTALCRFASAPPATTATHGRESEEFNSSSDEFHIIQVRFHFIQ